MSDLMKFLIQSYARKALTILGTYLMTHGILAEGTASSFASTYLEPVVGFLLIAGSTAWSTAYQWYVKRKVKKALAMPEGTTPKQLEKALEADSEK